MKLKNFEVDFDMEKINNTMIIVAEAAISEARDCNLDLAEMEGAIPFNYIPRNSKCESDLTKIVNLFCDTSYDDGGVIAISIERCVYAAIDAAYNIVHTDAMNIEFMIRSGYGDIYEPTNNDGWFDFHFYENSAHWRELVKIGAEVCPRYYPALRTFLKQELKYLCK